MFVPEEYMDTVERTIIDNIRLLHNRHEIRGDDRKWTIAIKELLADTGHSLGNYKVYATGCSNAEGGEWLYDVVWLRYEKGRAIDSYLVAESEWDSTEREINRDFQKLLIAKADLRVMVCNPMNKRTADETINDFVHQIRTYRKSSYGDRYLFAIWTKEEDNFNTKVYVNGG